MTTASTERRARRASRLGARRLVTTLWTRLASGRRAGTARRGCPDGILEEDLRAAGAGDDLVAEPHAGGLEAGDLAVEVVDDEVDPVPAARAGLRTVGHGAAGGARWVRSSRRRRLPRWTSAKAGIEVDDGEAEVAGVEVDGCGDVVDQVADVDGGVIGHGGFSLRVRSRSGDQLIDAGPRARQRSGRRRGRCRRRWRRRRPGRRMLQWDVAGAPGNSGQISRTLSHRVITWSKRLRAIAAQVLGGVAGDVDATLGHHPHRVGVQRLGMAAGAARLDRVPERCSSSASAICERALLPVHRNRTAVLARDVAAAIDAAEDEAERGVERRRRARGTARHSDQVQAVSTSSSVICMASRKP